MGVESPSAAAAAPPSAAVPADIMVELDSSDIEDIQEVFDLFDFWDGRDGLVDAGKIGDFLRCCGLNPTNEVVLKNGGVSKMGEKQYKFEEILPIYQAVAKETDTGTFADFMEAFKTFDREGQGFISSAEFRHVVGNLGEKMNFEDVDNILKWADTTEDLDGNLKYEEFIKKVMAGPPKK